MKNKKTKIKSEKLWSKYNLPVLLMCLGTFINFTFLMVVIALFSGSPLSIAALIIVSLSLGSSVTSLISTLIRSHEARQDLKKQVIEQ